MVNVHKWLDSQVEFSTKEKRSKLTYLNISNQNLEGELDLSDFVNIEELKCDNNKLTFLDASNLTKLKTIYCIINKISGFKLDNCPNLVKLDAARNSLTDLGLLFSSLNKKKIEWLSVAENSITESNLSLFNDFTNLKILYIGNPYCEKADFENGTYNHFYGSLEPLKNMLGLEELWISETDISTGLEYLSDSIKWIRCDEKKKPNAKVAKIYKELLPFGWELKIWKENNKGLVEKAKKEMWKEKGFDNEESEKIIAWDLKPNEYELANYLRNENKLLPQAKVGKLDQLKERYEKFLASKHSEEKINEFIHKYQKATDSSQLFEQIPYEQLTNIEYLAKGGFGKIYKAEWNWQNVILKSLNDSQKLTPEFLQEIASHKLFDSNAKQIVKCYGISHDPNTGNYLMVMEYVKGGNLRQYLSNNYSKLDLRKKFIQLHSIVEGLKNIHDQGLVHKDFHTGNILSSGTGVYFTDLVCSITDLGLCRPANETSSEKIYGVLPYVAPEVLRGQPYTRAADVYSFSIIASEILTGLPPYYNVDHDALLALEIVKGLRPNLNNIVVPQLLKDLIRRCWNADPLQRPTASELLSILNQWKEEINNNPNSEIIQQMKDAEEYNKNLPHQIKFPTYEKHSKAVYHSRLLPTEEITQLLEKSSGTQSWVIEGFNEFNLEDQEKVTPITSLPVDLLSRQKTEVEYEILLNNTLNLLKEQERVKLTKLMKIITRIVQESKEKDYYAQELIKEIKEFFRDKLKIETIDKICQLQEQLSKLEMQTQIEQPHK